MNRLQWIGAIGACVGFGLFFALVFPYMQAERTWDMPTVNRVFGLTGIIGGIVSLLVFAVGRMTEGKSKQTAVSQQTSRMKSCDNCGRAIGRMEKGQLWQGGEVCVECFDRLRKRA